jgi:hypothetical protein
MKLRRSVDIKSFRDRRLETDYFRSLTPAEPTEWFLDTRGAGVLRNSDRE